MLRGIYDWVMRLSASRHAQASMFAVSFAESSFFPVPPDVMLAPMVLARPDRAWRYAALCTLASVLGGMLGYAIGYFLTDAAVALMSLTGHSGGVDQFQCWYGKYGVWVILAKGMTPIPYKLVTIASAWRTSASRYSSSPRSSPARRGFSWWRAWSRGLGRPCCPRSRKRLALFAGIVIVLIVIGLAASHFIGGGGGAC